MRVPWPRAEQKLWVTGAAVAGALLLMSVPSPAGAQDVPAPLVNDRMFESVTVTSLGLVLWAAATWLRRQRPGESATHLTTSAHGRDGRPLGDARSTDDRKSNAA
jgi:hypothetical protein